MKDRIIMLKYLDFLLFHMEIFGFFKINKENETFVKLRIDKIIQGKHIVSFKEYRRGALLYVVFAKVTSYNRLKQSWG